MDRTESGFGSSLARTTPPLPPESAEFRPWKNKETNGSWIVYFARRGWGAPEYCLKVRKIVRSVAPSAAKRSELTAAQEYRVMGEIRGYLAAFPEFAASVPEPLLYLDASEAILTRYRQGRSLRDKLLLSGNALGFASGPTRANKLSTTLGRWLRLLHDMEPPGWLPVHGNDPGDLRLRIEEAAADLSHDLKRHLPLTQLLRWSGQVPADERLVMSHGDFQPGNLLVSASGFTVIDFATAGVRPAGADLAWFVAFVLSQRERVVLGNAAGTRRFVMKFCREFLSGYDFDFSRASQIVRPYLGLVVVERLAYLQKRIDHRPPPARPLLRNRLVGWADSELRWFLREFE